MKKIAILILMTFTCLIVNKSICCAKTDIKSTNTCTVKAGEKKVFTVSSTKKKIKWSSSNKKIATINKNGKVTAKKKGTCKIKAKVGKKVYTCKITVKSKYSYNPQNVVNLATKYTKQKGLIYIPDDLKEKLKNGKITQEEYDEYYPTDGAGYIILYVSTSLKDARSVSGTTKFKSEKDIAKHIAEMYEELPQKYFYIKYAGIEKIKSGKKCYVFYCYRA